MTQKADNKFMLCNECNGGELRLHTVGWLLECHSGTGK